MKTRFAALLLLLIFVLTLSASINASDVLSLSSASNEAYVISTDDFAKVFSGPTTRANVSKLMTEKRLRTVNVSIVNATVTGNDFSCILILDTGGKNVELPINGNLACGVRTQHGMNSIIVETPVINNGFKVRLFEIVNDSFEDPCLLYTSVDASKSLSGMPHIRVYIEDSNGVLYLFEGLMPKSLRTLDATKYPMADRNADVIMWGIDLVPQTITEIPVTDDLLEELGMTANNNRGLGVTTTWVRSSSYYSVFYIGSVRNSCISLPYLEYKHTNVGYGDSTWMVSFKVAEHTKMGDNSYYGSNIFSYTKLKFSFACGDKTTIIRTYSEGKTYLDAFMVQEIENGDSIDVVIFRNIVNLLPHGSEFLSALDLIACMTASDSTVMLGGAGFSLNTGLVVAAGELIPNAQFDICTEQNGNRLAGHYYTYQIVLQSEGATQNIETTGALEVEYDVLNGLDIYDDDEKVNFALDYSVIVN